MGSHSIKSPSYISNTSSRDNQDEPKPETDMEALLKKEKSLIILKMKEEKYTALDKLRKELEKDKKELEKDKKELEKDKKELKDEYERDKKEQEDKFEREREKFEREIKELKDERNKLQVRFDIVNDKYVKLLEKEAINQQTIKQKDEKNEQNKETNVYLNKPEIEINRSNLISELPESYSNLLKEEGESNDKKEEVKTLQNQEKQEKNDSNEQENSQILSKISSMSHTISITIFVN